MYKTHGTARRFLSLALIVILLIGLAPVMSVFAVDNGTIDLSRNYSGNLTGTNTTDRYTVVLARAGTLTVSITRDNSTAALPNGVADVVWLNSGSSQIASQPLNFPFSNGIELAAGTYHIEVVQRPGDEGTNVGTYTFQAVHVAASGGNTSLETAQSMSFGQTESGMLTSSETGHYYKVELTQPGRLTVTPTRGTLGATAYIRLLAPDGFTQIESRYVAAFARDLEAGTYYIFIFASASVTGTYQVRADFAAANNNEIEPNNDPTQAQTITFGQTVRGFISYQDSVDFYRVVLTEPGRLTVTPTRGTLGATAYIRLFESNGTTQIDNKYITTLTRDLEAGVYFVSISGSVNLTGTYDLRVDFTAAGNNETEPNNDRNQAQLLAVGQTVKGFISHQDHVDFYRFVITAPSRITVLVTRGTISSSATVRLLRSDGTQIDSKYLGTNIVRDLEAGTYFVSVTGSVNITGTYDLTVNDDATGAVPWTTNPASITFQQATPGYPTQAAQSVTIRNTSTGTIALNGITASLTTGGSHFEITSAPSASVAPNATTTVSVRPRAGLAAGTYSGVLTITTANGGNKTVPLTFVVSNVTWTLSQTNINFPAAKPGYAAFTPQVVTIRNTGSAGTPALTGVTASLTSGAANFEITSSPTASLAAGATTTVSVRPRIGLAAGVYSGVVTVSTGSGSNIVTQTITLSFTVGAATVQNPHASWAAVDLQKALELDLFPDVLLNPSVDLRLRITRAEFAGVVVKAYEALANTTALPAVVNPFTDTNSLDVLKAYNAELMIGTGDTLFSPNSLLTREQAATALTRVFKKVTMPGWTYNTDVNFKLSFTQPPLFADHSSISSWARESVYFMAANDIIEGVGNNRFAPRAVTSAEQASGYAQATRQQALIIAMRMVEKLG